MEEILRRKNSSLSVPPFTSKKIPRAKKRRPLYKVGEYALRAGSEDIHLSNKFFNFINLISFPISLPIRPIINMHLPYSKMLVLWLIVKCWLMSGKLI